MTIFDDDISTLLTARAGRPVRVVTRTHAGATCAVLSDDVSLDSETVDALLALTGAQCVEPAGSGVVWIWERD